MKPQLTTDWRYPRNAEEMEFGSTMAAGRIISPNAGWRVFKPEIDHEKCIRCLLCYVYCPDGVIDKAGSKLAIDYDFCKGCGICAHECPKKAIAMVKEAK